MTRIAYSSDARADVVRLVDFLAETEPETARATADLISEAVQILPRHPEIGRRVGKELCELVISRGRSGYLALYHFDVRADEALILAIRHQRESGYHQEDL
ncbi:type II toxin-antitoxin system RelE/ParE family toxin [Variovorax sp. dw_308]|uniref:type II toxin-antitoxin system RelE/ParE family toxin n=1 Tax=Variovorax sp. dw_308 TaxID=2721546 RepID=UPI001C443BBB